MLTVREGARIALKNILFPTDFSPASSAALPFALTLARIYGSTLLVTHVIPPEPRRQVVADRLPAQDARAWQEAQHKLAGVTQDRSIGDTPCKALVDQGDLADVIPAMISEQEVDLVVLGTHGRRGVSKLVLGSSAEKIYRSAQCPVLTVGPKVHASVWELHRILCPIDVVEDPKPCLHYALSLAEESQAEFIVLQAVPLVPWQHRASVEAQMRSRLETLIPDQARDWCTPQFLVRWEHPAEAVLLAAAEREVDLIVMGVRKARAARLSSHLPWPVASEVVSRAPCPVLTVRV
jgi:nucleotide-binding universal stress UspA family protein